MTIFKEIAYWFVTITLLWLALHHWFGHHKNKPCDHYPTPTVKGGRLISYTCSKCGKQIEVKGE